MPADATVAHPYLATAAATAHHWLDHHAFHAGAFVVDGIAWAVVGDRQIGKSTTLGRLAIHGLDVLTDDLLVVDDGWVYAGPRCLDLRANASRHMGVGAALDTSGRAIACGTF